MQTLYAHTKNDPRTGQPLPESFWQPLEEHLNAVAQQAAEFASAFYLDNLGLSAGLLHDIGKSSAAFQQRLRGSRDAVDHKSEGARLAYERYGPAFGKLLAYAIYGHHNGLPDDIAKDSAGGLNDVLAAKSAYAGDLLVALPAPQHIMNKNLSASTHQGMAVSMLTRMIFSCLVDADFLDTEHFKEPAKYQARGSFLAVDELYRCFMPKRDHLLHNRQNTTVGQARHNVLTACLAAARDVPGLFSLTVPTGGGKTLSSLAFALEHAHIHGKSRIIYAIPFTSIIEQTAKVFRDIFGEQGVLEHHSNVVNERERDDEFDINRLASENWQAGLIVTTNVQLFESLFSNKPSQARKLHQLANSIIILDEAQTLPDNLLLPCLAALRCLCADYGATVLLCTATQPALMPEWLGGIAPCEIIADPPALYRQLQRNTVHMLGKLGEEELAERLLQHQQALCIVNTRNEAQRLYEICMGHGSVFHLSALMCAEHRSKILADIRQRLKENQPCLVISTQLIEAGVDIDFPVVYRALAGVDAVAQAAGRCNREGKRQEGPVYLFEPEHGLPPGPFKRLGSLTQQVLLTHDNPLQLEAVHEYFSLRYMFKDKLDENHILSTLTSGAGKFSFPFREIAANFKFIDSPMTDIIIPYDDKAREILAEAKTSRYPASYARQLQRYSVSVYPHELAELKERRRIDMIADSMYALTVDKKSFDAIYSPSCGLQVQAQLGLLML